jgi:hypothetical protein
MDTQQQMEERLWNYIDGNCSVNERSVINDLVAKDAAWKLKYQELLEVNELLLSSDLEAPSMRFTKNVMEEIGKLQIAPAARAYINKKVIWGLGFFFIAMIIGFLVYGLGQMDLTTGESNTFASKLGQVDISKFFSNTWVNAFMMVNVVLGLFLFDSFLNDKRKEFRNR